MTTVDKSALVRYSAQQMYDLVSDIETYPDFLPWCKSADIHREDSTHVEASITIARSGFSQQFTTINTLVPGVSMELQFKSGPFSHLHGIWKFDQLGNEGSKVSLHMEFEFSNVLIGKAFGPVFGRVVDSMVNSFCARADDVYGR